MEKGLVHKIAPKVLGVSLALIPTNQISHCDYLSKPEIVQPYEKEIAGTPFVSKRVRFLTNYEPPEPC